MTIAAAAPLDARSLDSVTVTEHDKIPFVRPDWPVPSEPGQLFYVQRSTNSNAVVYTARFDSSGNLDPKTPVSVYWRRYDSNGARKALSFFEDRFGYGVSARRDAKPGIFTITPRALSKIKLQLYQIGPGKAELRVSLGGRMVRPVYAYISIDEGGLIPKVVSISVHGIDPDTERAITETFRVNGGDILQ